VQMGLWPQQGGGSVYASISGDVFDGGKQRSLPIVSYIPPRARASIIMSRSSTNGWLRGTTVRKGGATSNSQRPSQGHVVSTSNTIFGGGVKDPSGRTSEYFVRRARSIQEIILLTTSSSRSRWMTNVQYANLIGI